MHIFALILEATSREYDPRDISLTMTVGEFKEFLNDYHDETRLFISTDGHLYGPVREGLIGETDWYEYEEDDE